MPKRGENIYKRKDGRWEGRYIKSRPNGRIRYGYVYAASYRETKDKLLSVRNLTQEANSSFTGEGHFSKRESPEHTADSFAFFAEQWLSAAAPQLKDSTIARYRNILNLHLLPQFGEYELTEITQETAESFSRKLLSADGKGLSPKTVAGILSVLKGIIEYAGRLTDCQTADLHKVTVRQPQKPLRILSRTEQQRLSGYLCEYPSPVHLGILLCLYTGMRIGEVCALKWEDISFDGKYISVSKTLQRIQTFSEGSPKTSVTVSAPKSSCSVRRIPLPDGICRYLVPAKCPGNCYFLTGHPRFYLEPRTLQNRFKAVIRECRLEDVNFHVLRHTFATRCIELQFDIKSLSEILGHASVNITLNRYVHPSMELKQKNMNLLSEIIG